MLCEAIDFDVWDNNIVFLSLFCVKSEINNQNDWSSWRLFLDVLLWECFCFWMNKPSAGDNLLRVAQNRWLVAQNKWAKISLNRVMHTRYVTVRKNQIAIDFQARRCLFLALTKSCLLIFCNKPSCAFRVSDDAPRYLVKQKGDFEKIGYSLRNASKKTRINSVRISV